MTLAEEVFTRFEARLFAGEGSRAEEGSLRFKAAGGAIENKLEQFKCFSGKQQVRKAVLANLCSASRRVDVRCLI